MFMNFTYDIVLDVVNMSKKFWLNLSTRSLIFIHFNLVCHIYSLFGHPMRSEEHTSELSHSGESRMPSSA